MAKDKKKKKKDPEKKAALQAKKEAKADKSVRKRLQKESGGGNNSETQISDNNNNKTNTEFDDLLQNYRRKHPDVATTVLEPLETSFPVARANATLTLTADDSNNNTKMYLFGGEYYDGVENVVLDELLQYDIGKQEWKRIVTPLPRPGARCAHSTVYYKQALYVFGGEFATADSYHHYKDVWKLDLTSKTWVELSPHKGSAATPPTARSGHAAWVWKHYMILFGGFYEALRDTKWYQDVHVLDLLTEKWVQLPEPSRLSSRPEPRSACNVAVLSNEDAAAIIQGGFSKLKKSNSTAAAPGSSSSTSSVYESKVHTDTWMLNLSPLLHNKPPTWERLPNIKSHSLTATPLGRAGMAHVTYKNQLVAFGGVCDTEHHHHVMQSVFYNDLWALDLERRKWFPIRIQEKKNEYGTDRPRRRRRRQRRNEKQAAAEQQQQPETTKNNSIDETNDEEEDDDDGDDEHDNGEVLDDEEQEDEEEEEARGDAANHEWDLEKLRSNMFAFIDSKGNMVYEKIPGEGDEKASLHASLQGKAKAVIKEEEEDEEKGDDEDEEDEEKEEDESDKEDNVRNKPKPVAAESKPESFTTLTSSSVMTLNRETKLPEPVTRTEPLPRINAEMVIHGNSTLYMYGGLLEVGDREVTLDDFWKLDLKKRDKWECLYPGTMHKQVWRGATHDDDDSYVSTGADDNDEDEDNEDDDEENEDNDEEDGHVNVAEYSQKIPKPDKEKVKSKRSLLRQEIASLKAQHDLNDDITPQAGEAVAEFYARTSEYWNEQAATASAAAGNGQPLSTKELRRDGFNLARRRFDDLQPILDRLKELNLQYQEADQEKKERKEERDEKKKSRRYR